MAKRPILYFFAICMLSGTLRPFADAQSDKEKRIRRNVDLVQAWALVFDREGKVALGLEKKDFRVFEDGVEQDILDFSKEREAASIMVIADVSQSMASKIPFVQKAAEELVDPAYRRKGYPDEFSVIVFGTRAHMAIPFTRDQDDVTERLPKILESTDGATALNDAVYLGIDQLKGYAANKRRAAIVISDGGDNHSRYHSREIRRLLKEADVPVYAVMTDEPWTEIFTIFTVPLGIGKIQVPVKQGDFIGPDERNGPSNLKGMAEASGGAVFTAHTEEDIPRIVKTIGLAVRYHYLITYSPSGTKKIARPKDWNNWHKLKIELAPKSSFEGYAIYSKHGYYHIPD